MPSGDRPRRAPGNVRVMMQVLAPGMEYSDKADLGTEVTRIGSDCAQCFGRRPEQDAVDRRLVLERDCGDLGW